PVRGAGAACLFVLALLAPRLVLLPYTPLFRSTGRVALAGPGVVGGVRVAAVGGGVAAIAAIGVAAMSRGVATLGLRLAAPAERERLRVPVVDLGVAGVGVAAVPTGRGGVAASRVVVALVDRRLVSLVGLRAVALVAG